MSNSPRVVGKYGRKAAVFPAGLRTLDYYAAARELPGPPAAVTVPAVAVWGMDGNDQYGDCGVAGINHGFMSAAADTSETEAFPGDAGIVSYYLKYTGGADDGVVLSDFLAYVKKTGFFGHTVAAYAPVSISDIRTLQFATYAYDFAYAGISVTQAMEQAFQDGRPWTLADARGMVVGGHCVPVVGYDSNYLYVVTWGQVQPVAYTAWRHIASEAWAVISGEITAKGDDGHGINLTELQADLSQLDTPSPAPPPAQPGVLAELAVILRRAEADAEEIVDDARAFLSRHGL